MKTTEEQIVFMLGAPEKEGDPPSLVFAIPEAAWKYMEGGKTHTFDFRGVGINLQATIYRGKNHADCMRSIEKAASAAGITIVDERRRDFKIKGER